MLTAHDLARKLLSGPDLTVRFQDEESAFSGYVEDVDKSPGDFCACDDFPQFPIGANPTDDRWARLVDAAPWKPCITLEVGSTDTILRGDSIVERYPDGP
jgi:hypothetical protein